MADRPTITTLSTGAKYDTDTLNTNFQNLRNAFDNVVGVAGTGGSNNAMTGDLDLDGNTIRNGTFGELDDQVAAAAASAAAAAASETAAGVSETNAAASAASAASSANGLANIAALQAATTGTYTGLLAYILGYYTEGDGGEGHFWYDASDTTSSDNGGTIIVDASGRRWKRNLNGMPVTFKQFGAVGDGTTDDSTKLQACIDWALAQGAGQINAGSGIVYAVDTTVTISNSDIHLFGKDVELKAITGITSSQGVLKIDSGTTSYRANRIVLNGISIDGNAIAGYGLHLVYCGFVTVFGGDFHDAVTRNVYLSQTLGAAYGPDVISFYGSHAYNSTYGWHCDAGNSIRFYGCVADFNDNGCWVNSGITNYYWYSGDIEQNRKQGVLLNGGKSIMFDAVGFENNATSASSDIEACHIIAAYFADTTGLTISNCTYKQNSNVATLLRCHSAGSVIGLKMFGNTLIDPTAFSTTYDSAFVYVDEELQDFSYDNFGLTDPITETNVDRFIYYAGSVIPCKRVWGRDLAAFVTPEGVKGAITAYSLELTTSGTAKNLTLDPSYIARDMRWIETLSFYGTFDAGSATLTSSVTISLVSKDTASRFSTAETTIATVTVTPTDDTQQDWIATISPRALRKLDENGLSLRVAMTNFDGTVKGCAVCGW